MTILTAQVAKVNFPVKEGFIEGLMDENGDFYVAVPQLCGVFSVTPNNATRDIKALLGKESQLTKLKTPLNPKPVNALPVKYLQPLILELTIKGNPVATDCSRALISLSVIELFNDAFSIPNTPETRNWFVIEWNNARQMSRNSHAGFALACIQKKHPGNQVHDYLTVLIFGDTAKAARMKTLVASDEKLDPTIGLNHQEDIDGMRKIAIAKASYSRMKVGTWEEQVERAVANALKTK